MVNQQVFTRHMHVYNRELNVSERFPPAAGLAEFSRLTQRGWDFLKHVEEIKDK